MRMMPDATTSGGAGGGVRDALLIATVYASLAGFTSFLPRELVSPLIPAGFLAAFVVSTAWVARRSGARWIAATMGTAGAAGAVGILWAGAARAVTSALPLVPHASPDAIVRRLIHGTCFGPPSILSALEPSPQMLLDLSVAGLVFGLLALPVGWIARRAWRSG